MDLQPSTILCCLCGTRMQANAANMCVTCLSSQVDLSQEIATSGHLVMCKQCHRWQTKSKQFIQAELESRELLSLCLKYIQGLSKVRVVDAHWIWTEPHSRRVKVRVNVQKEVLNGVEIQQKVEVEFVVRTLLCDDCVRSESEHTWRAMVQVRQRVEHKKTFFFLEQVLLHRKGLQESVLDLEMVKDGMDVYFLHKEDANRFCNLLGTTVPVRIKASRKLLSEDRQNNTHINQHTFVVEIVPLCKDDLVLVPTKAFSGVVAGLCLVSRVTSNLHIIEPSTLNKAEISSTKYWRHPLTPLLSSKDLVQYEVLDVEIEGGGSGGGCFGDDTASISTRMSNGMGRLGLVEVARSSDFGVNDVTYHVMTHIAHLLSAGDTVLGYDLKSANLNTDEELRSSLRYDPPDVILVKKIGDPDAKREKRRLQRMKKKQEARRMRASSLGGGGKGGGGGRVMGEEGVGEEEYMEFLKEVEEDDELWGRIIEQDGGDDEVVGEVSDDGGNDDDGDGGHVEMKKNR